LDTRKHDIILEHKLNISNWNTGSKTLIFEQYALG